MNTFAKADASLKYYVDGNLVSSSGFDAHYDGDIFTIDSYDNDKRYFMELNADDIQDLLTIPSSQNTLEKRLTQHLSSRNTSNKKKSISSNSTKKSSKKSNKKNTRKSSKKSSKKSTRKIVTTPIDRTIY